MHLKHFVVLLVAPLAVCAFIASHDSAAAQNMQTCPTFTATKWVSPMPGPKPSGDQYMVTLTGASMSCAQATTWAKKLIAQHIAGKPMMPSYPPLKGGPHGYVCKGSPDTTGHAWRGSCLKSSGGAGLAPGFSWTND